MNQKEVQREVRMKNFVAKYCVPAVGAVVLSFLTIVIIYAVL